jgi:phosphohistidine swiveling domain-containing protein
MFDFDHDPYNYEYFLKQFKQIKKPKKELAKINDIFKVRRKQYFTLIKKLTPDKNFRLLLKFLQENVFLRDHRDMIRQKLNLLLKEIYSEIGKRIGLNVSRVAILTNDEIISYLKSSKKFPTKLIAEREKFFLLIQKSKQAKIFSGHKAERIAKQELKPEKQKNISSVSGMIGSPGKARGKVKIVLTNRDLKKVKRGDILIAAMTRQDFISAMQLSGAIVTDEGSIICHAAITARELEKPAIVGTKIATKIFKDGDLVEVDADKGIVRKIK